MQTEDGIVLQKTQELCQTILNQPEFQTLRRDVEAFLGNESAKALYQAVVDKGEELHRKQHAGEALGRDEVAAFEGERDALMNNTVAKSFMDAQQAMQRVQETVSQYVGKTFELGRVPTPEEFSSGSCGSGCGCHH